MRHLAAQVLDTYPRLDVLVNNTGGFWAHRHVTADGLEHTFALNHLAPFLLTSLLLDRLTASAPARILNVSSAAHTRGRIDYLQGESSVSGVHPERLAHHGFTWCVPAGQRLFVVRGGVEQPTFRFSEALLALEPPGTTNRVRRSYLHICWSELTKPF